MREKLDELARLRGAATGSKEYFVPYGGSEVYSAAKVFVARFMRTADAKWFAAIHNAFPAILDALEAAERERDELRADAERYRYIRRAAMIEQCSGKKRHNRISWPTIHAADPVDGGNYRDRFDSAIDAQIRRERESKLQEGE
jgi:hypothetical protein